MRTDSPQSSVCSLIVLSLILLAIITVNGLSLADETPSHGSFSFTKAERAWIHTHPVIRVCPDPTYPPFEYFDEKGEYKGLSADLLSEVASRTGLVLEPVQCDNWSVCIDKIQNKEVDILGAVYISDIRSDYLRFSEPYYTTPLQIVTRKNTDSDLTLDDLTGMSVAVVGGYTSHLLLELYYPDITLVVVPDIPTGLEKVVFGSADAYFGDYATAAYHVEREGLSNLQVSGEYLPSDPKYYQMAFGVRSDYPMLVSILNKGLLSIPDDKRTAISNRWISTALERPILSHTIVRLLLGSIGLFIAVILGFLLWNYYLRRAVAEKTGIISQELQEKTRYQTELIRKNEELSAANEELAATEEELRHQYQQLEMQQEELIRSEESLKRIRFSIDQSHDLMIWFDDCGIIRDVSESVTRTLEYQRDELVSSPIDVIDPGIMESIRGKKSTFTQDRSITFETAFLSRSGQSVPVEVTLIPFEYAMEHQILLSAKDIHERREMEDLKKKAFSQIDQNIEQFSILNDQIRNPLTVLMILAEEMEDENQDKIMQQIHRIDEIVDKLDSGLLHSEKVRAFLRRYYSR